jgi:hypothetical protein
MPPLAHLSLKAEASTVLDFALRAWRQKSLTARGIFASDEADDDGGLTPTEENNKARRK